MVTSIASPTWLLLKLLMKSGDTALSGQEKTMGPREPSLHVDVIALALNQHGSGLKILDYKIFLAQSWIRELDEFWDCK